MIKEYRKNQTGKAKGEPIPLERTIMKAKWIASYLESGKTLEALEKALMRKTKAELVAMGQEMDLTLDMVMLKAQMVTAIMAEVAEPETAPEVMPEETQEEPETAPEPVALTIYQAEPQEATEPPREPQKSIFWKLAFWTLDAAYSLLMAWDRICIKAPRAWETVLAWWAVIAGILGATFTAARRAGRIAAPVVVEIFQELARWATVAALIGIGAALGAGKAIRDGWKMREEIIGEMAA